MRRRLAFLKSDVSLQPGRARELQPVAQTHLQRRSIRLGRYGAGKIGEQDRRLGQERRVHHVQGRDVRSVPLGDGNRVLQRVP